MMADVRELGRKVKAKYPGKYDDLSDDDLGRKVKAKYPGAYDDFTDAPPAPTGESQGVLSSFQTGLAGPLLRNVVETAADFYNAPGETLERVGRAGLEFASAFDPAGNAYRPTVEGQAARVAELNRRADERLPEPIQSMKRGMALEEAKPRTRGGRIAGVTGSILGEVAFPTAPETAVANIVTAPFAGAAAKTVGRAIAPILKRIRGRNVPVAVAEAPVATGEVLSTGPAPARRPIVAQEAAELPSGPGRVVTVGDDTFRLTPEQEARWVAEVDANPARNKADAMRLAATKRDIVNAPTAKEEAAAIAREKTNYRGKSVSVNGQPATVTGTTFGRIKVRLQDGSEISVSPDSISSPTQIRGTGAVADRYGFQQAFAGTGQAIGDNLKNALRASVAKTGKLPGAERNSAIGKAYESAVAGGAPRDVTTLDAVMLAAEQASIRPQTGVAALESPGALPTRQSLADGPPPLLEVAEEAPFGVSLGKERAPTPGARGPRFDEAVELELRKKLDPVAKAAERSPWQDTTLAYFRANLLTNPAGRAADLGSTLINQFADAAIRPVAGAVDIAVSKLTGARSITGISPRGTGRALGSIKQGLKDAKEVLKTGKQAIDSGADDAVYSAEVRSGLGKPVDLPINGVFRVLGALDAPFRRFGYARNLYDRARVAASNEARRGAIPRDQLLARTRQLLDDEGIIRAAVRDGEAAVLSEPNAISSWLAKQTADSPNARLALGIVQPFMRIPLNAVLKAADFSGIGGVKALYKVARGVGRKARGKQFFRDLEEQRVFSQNVAAGSFGPAAFLLGMELEDQGKMEGYYYTSKKDYPNGKTLTSINIRGQNYDINRLGGFIFAPLFIGATYNRLRKQGSGKLDAYLSSFGALVQTAPALGYYGVPAKLGRFFTADEKGAELEKEAGGIASGFIPASGALGAAAKALDPVAKREAEGFTGPIMNRIPGLRERLPVKKNKKNTARR